MWTVNIFSHTFSINLQILMFAETQDYQFTCIKYFKKISVTTIVTYFEVKYRFHSQMKTLQIKRRILTFCLVIKYILDSRIIVLRFLLKDSLSYINVFNGFSSKLKQNMF